MSKIVDIAFLEREQLCAIVLKKEMKVIHLQTSIFEEKISELMFFVGFCWKWRIYCRENRKAWRFLENFDNGNSMLWSSLIPGKNNTRSSSFLFPTEKFFFCATFWKTLKNNFLSKCENRFSLKNGEFIARKIWTTKGLLHILTTQIWSRERPWYPEKNTELNPHSMAWILLVKLKLFSILAKKRLLKNHFGWKFVSF